MTRKNLRGVLRLGRRAFKEKDRKKAHFFFSIATTLEPDNIEAWLGMASCTDDPCERLTCFQRVMELDSNSRPIKAALRWAKAELERGNQRGEKLSSAYGHESPSEGILELNSPDKRAESSTDR